MVYSDFTLEKVKTAFELQIIESIDLFEGIGSLTPTERLRLTLEETASLASAINTEKARAEFLIAPVLLEVKRQKNSVSLFSGIDFNVAPSLGLTGFVDFILSKSPEQYFVQAPTVIVVSAKNENIKAGLGIAIAQTIAADIFTAAHVKGGDAAWDIKPDRQEVAEAIAAKNDKNDILGVVTTGEIWKFLHKSGNQIQIDRRSYFLNEVGTILAILLKYL